MGVPVEIEDNRYANAPIPSYEEAVAQHGRGPTEVSDDAERQGLLGASSSSSHADSRTRAGGYRAPTVESARSSIESDLSVPEMVEDGEGARRQVEEFDYMEPGESEGGNRGQARLYHRARLRSKISQGLTNLSATLSAIRLPSFRSFYSPVPATDGDAAEAQPTTSSRFSRLRESVRLPEGLSMGAANFARLFGLFTIFALVWVLFAMDIFPSSMSRMGMHFDPESVRSYVQDHLDVQNIEEALRHITSFDHVAGTEGDLYLARWMEEKWIKEGMFDDIKLWSYFVYLNYPTKDGRSVEIVSPETSRWKAAVEENDVSPATPNRAQTLAWHGHSKSGEVEGPLVYANGGSREDFKHLSTHGVELNGTIALVRYHISQEEPGLKIKAAQDAGCVGVIMYSDPAVDGAGKGEIWPAGPWRPTDAVERESVSLVSWVIGDPLTPGWASNEGAKRVDVEDNPRLVSIPSLPIGWRDAEPLLKALQGHGLNVPEKWVGGPPGFASRWASGNASNDAPVVHLKNLNDESTHQKIWNLHGLIQGIETPNKKIVIGNHRDSWCFGSVDAGSGSAVMMELVRIFGELRKLGWRPLRTIEFASWDAGEFNMMGSTEYVEDNVEYLRGNAIAYLNVGAGVFGSNFRAGGSPAWERSLLRVLDRVTDPNTNNSIKQLWEQSKTRMQGLGAEGDYVAFQDIAGTSSIDFGFEGPKNGYPAHSCYETMEWMSKFGDPNGLPYHLALAQIWALLILDVADRPLLPYDLNHYADSISGYIESLRTDAQITWTTSAGKPSSKLTSATLDFKPLEDATASLKDATSKFHEFEDTWTRQVLGRGGLETNAYTFRRLDYNDRITNFESDLLDLPDPDAHKAKGRKYGIPGREQYKHVLHGPQEWRVADEAFPAIRSKLAARDFEGAQEMVNIAADRIRKAGENLVK
ncbi:hypothetical protein WHR41_08302 [Cladosporium halotolerans]|uniref:Uncharacterized protein n=1 Tax=Cladosporium halotolerans TaxID=1052096 RepID=A0AB34KHQ6_9PEZI